jgi:cytochrome b6-f complex iron-sulfur subunit
MERGEVDPGPPGPESSGRGTEGLSPGFAMPDAPAVGTPAPSGSVEGTNDGLIGRRRFIRLVVGCSIVSLSPLVVTPVVGFLIPRKTEGAGTGGRTLAGTTTDIPPGSGKVVAMGSSPVIVINTESGVKAFSAVCTHLGCIVGYDSTAKAIICPCHDGRFNPATGAVVSGPPPAPLKPITVAVEKDQIYLVEG